MANYSTLIGVINDQIKANGNQEITGPVLNAVLRSIVSGMSEGALFAGIATPITNPLAYDGDVFYIATIPGTYSNFGVIVPRGRIGVLYNTSSGWAVSLINMYYTINVDTLMQDSPSSDDIDEAIGGFAYLKRAIISGAPFFGMSVSGGNSTVAIVQVKQLADNEVRVVMLNTGTIDGSNELVPIIKKITNSEGQLSLSTEAPTSFIGPLSSLSTNEKGSVVGAINEVNTGLKSTVKPYVVDLTDLLAAQDSESISTAIGGIDNLNGTVQKNQVIFGILANGTVAVGIRVLGNQTTLTYFVDSVVGLTVNEVIITNTSGTLTKTVNTHAVLTENMVVNNLESDEATLPLSAAQGKVLSEEVNTTYQKKNDNTLATTDKTVVGAINEVHESAQELIGMTGFRQVSSVNAPVKIDNMFRNVDGKTASTDDYALYAPLSLTRGQVIAGVVTASSAVAIVSRIDEEGNWIECLVSGPGSAEIYYVAEEDMTVEICCTKLSYPNLRIYSADITKEIAKNTSDISRLDIASTQPDIEEINLDEGVEEGKYWHTGGTKKAESKLNCKTVQLEKGDMLFVTGYANKNVYIIAQVNSDNTSITSTKLSVPGKENTGQVLKYSFIAAERCTVAVSYYKAFKHEAFIVRAEVNAAVARLAGSMTALHAIYESNGAVYNENTGYWELNGLTDLTEDEMYDIYLWTNNLINQPDLDNALSYAPIRTTFAPVKSIYRQANGVSINQMAVFCTNLEIFNINSKPDSQMSLKAVGTAAHNAFAGCMKLREIKQILYLSNLVTENIFSAAFSNCQQLRKVMIRGLKQKVSFKDSPLISYESLNYIVANAANTAAITITVHDTTYSYLTGTAQPTEEVGGSSEEWQALVTTAQGKQISFAQPAETLEVESLE